MVLLIDLVINLFFFFFLVNCEKEVVSYELNKVLKKLIFEIKKKIMLTPFFRQKISDYFTAVEIQT